MKWTPTNEKLPAHGKNVLMYMTDGSVHEGHFILHANKYQKNVRRWRLYKTGKTVPEESVVAWAEMPEGNAGIDPRRWDDVLKEKLP